MGENFDCMVNTRERDVSGRAEFKMCTSVDDTMVILMRGPRNTREMLRWNAGDAQAVMCEGQVSAPTLSTRSGSAVAHSVCAAPAHAPRSSGSGCLRVWGLGFRIRALALLPPTSLAVLKPPPWRLSP